MNNGMYGRIMGNLIVTKKRNGHRHKGNHVGTQVHSVYFFRDNLNHIDQFKYQFGRLCRCCYCM